MTILPKWASPTTQVGTYSMFFLEGVPLSTLTNIVDVIFVGVPLSTLKNIFYAFSRMLFLEGVPLSTLTNIFYAFSRMLFLEGVPF